MRRVTAGTVKAHTRTKRRHGSLPHSRTRSIHDGVGGGWVGGGWVGGDWVGGGGGWDDRTWDLLVAEVGVGVAVNGAAVVRGAPARFGTAPDL
jgi:hypothetical protein